MATTGEDRPEANSPAAGSVQQHGMADDATFQNEGDVIQGRATIEANRMRLMAKLPPGTRLEDKANSSRVIAPDVIVCHSISQRIASNGISTEMYFVRVLVRQGDRWLLAATQIARPSTLPKSSSQPK
jgi:uncharacterized protein (TIGR02246 family)